MLKKIKEELGEKKKKMLKKISEGKDFSQFYPSEHDLEYLPQNSVLIKIPFTLKKPYTSKDEGEFHIVYVKEKGKKGAKDFENPKVFENPIVESNCKGQVYRLACGETYRLERALEICC